MGKETRELGRGEYEGLVAGSLERLHPGHPLVLGTETLAFINSLYLQALQEKHFIIFGERSQGKKVCLRAALSLLDSRLHEFNYIGKNLTNEFTSFAKNLNSKEKNVFVYFDNYQFLYNKQLLVKLVEGHDWVLEGEDGPNFIFIIGINFGQDNQVLYSYPSLHLDSIVQPNWGIQSVI